MTTPPGAGDGLAYDTREANPAVVALFQDDLARGLNCDIHAEDEMYLVFLHSHLAVDRERALVMYFESGRLIWSTLRALIERRPGGLAAAGNLLDFAAGYGRATRFMVQDVPPERVWVAEIDPAAVAFQERAFGVHGLLSASRPQDLRTDERFGCIVVSSLFTHLPADDFRAWLERLLRLLEPAGLLLFSVHGRELLEGAPESAVAPSAPVATLAPAPSDAAGERELVFQPSSESRSLPAAEYGSSWVSEGFVRAALAETAGALGLAIDVRRFPRGLVSLQDLYAVALGGAPAPDLPPPPAEGVVEHCSWQAGNVLEVSGWVVDRRRRRRPRRVTAEIDGRLADTATEFAPRPEIGELHRDPTLAGHGFRLRPPLAPGRPAAGQTLRLAVVWEDGETSLLDEAPVLAALLRASRLDRIGGERQAAAMEEEWRQRLAVERAERAAERGRLEASLADAAWRAAGLEARIAAMKASRFWKLRDRWFALKRALRLTREM
ncbi:MAG TPA: class I SAM-dependent methyltransferase [Thermoanaerobaculia bacterium]